HRDARHPEGEQILGQRLALLHRAPVGEVAAEEEEIRHLVDVLHEGPEAPVLVLAAVQVAGGSHSHLAGGITPGHDGAAPPRPAGARRSIPRRRCPDGSSPWRGDSPGTPDAVRSPPGGCPRCGRAARSSPGPESCAARRDRRSERTADGPGAPPSGGPNPGGAASTRGAAPPSRRGGWRR